MTKPIKFLLILLAVSLSGCAKTVLQADVDPNSTLVNVNTMYVRKLPTDGRGIERLIASKLNELGFEASTGAAIEPPREVDAIVTYQDNWMWDITMYMIQLNIQIRAPDTEYVMASGRSYRTSLVRQSPEYMVEEVLREIFAGHVDLPPSKLEKQQ